MYLKKYVLVTMIGACMLSATGCAKTGAPAAEDGNVTAGTTETAAVAEPGTGSTDEGNAEQLANPFVEYATVDEAAEALKFSVKIPDSIDGYKGRTISVMSGHMFQVVYSGDGKEICIRKQIGSGDISGDFTTYAQTRTVDFSGSGVIVKGNDDMIYNATWIRDGYCYSITSTKGLSEAEIITLVAQTD